MGNYEKDYGTTPSGNPRAEFDAAVAAGLAMGRSQEIGITRFIVLPEKAKVHEFDTARLQTLERQLSGKPPVSATGTITVQDAASFIAYFNLFRDSASIVFADEVNKHIVGIIDYHNPLGEAAWKRHVVAYTPIHSDQWNTWHRKNNVNFTQADFALFVEDNLIDVVEPTGATLLEIAKTLEAKSAVEFSSAVRLNNGQVQLTYTEEIRGTASQGQLEIPETFKLGITPFLNTPTPYAVVARLRYRLTQGKVVFWFRMNNVERIIQDSFNGILQQIQTATEAQIIRGTQA